MAENKDSLKEKAKSAKDRISGEIKDTQGDLTGDTSKKVEGKIQKGKGKAEGALGKLKEDPDKKDNRRR